MWSITSCACGVKITSRRRAAAGDKHPRTSPLLTLLATLPHTRHRPFATLNSPTTHAPIIICLGMSIVD